MTSVEIWSKINQLNKCAAKGNFEKKVAKIRGRKRPERTVKMQDVLTNKKLSASLSEKLSALAAEGDPILFVISGELTLKSKYGSNLLAVTGKELIVYDDEKDEVVSRTPFDSIEKIYSKRMYGNGLVRAVLKGSEKPVDLFRFTFSIAALCDAAVFFVNNVKEGENLEEQLEAVHSVYEKQLSVCPKCGRNLSAPGVQCINCQSKKKVIGKLAGYMKPEIGPLVFSVIVSVITTAIALLPPLLTKYLVDDVLNREKTPTTEAITLLGYVAIFLVSMHIVRYFLAAWRGFILRKSGDRIVAAIRNDVYEKAQHLPMRFYDKTSTGSVINRVSGDSSTLQAFMLRISQEVIVQFFKLIGIIIIMMVMDWRLTLLSLIPVPLVAIFSRNFRKKIAPFYRKIWRKWSAVSSILADTIPCVRVVKSFTGEDKSTGVFKKANDNWYKTDAKAGLILNVFPATVNCLIACGSVIIWILGGRMVINGTDPHMTVGLLVSFISYASMFYEPVNFFANLSDSYQSALASAERIFDILDAEPESDFGKGNVLPEIKGKIRFSNVSFSFDRSKKVLKHINLTIEPGDIVGIVGTTGSGKSTLINLLLRYYDNYQGRIYVDDVDIRKIDIKYFRSQIGYVQQEPQMFHDTIYNNIAYGDRDYTVDEVMRAADIANAHEFIIRQPDGYDSVLGERGVGLSGGERQRLSIARAVLKNPSILVFDEATASVDSETEHYIQEAIENLISGRTTIMIAHRLSTLSKANKIVVVDNGEIIECGTPEELMEMKGKYFRLVEIQSMSDKLNETKRAERFE